MVDLDWPGLDQLSYLYLAVILKARVKLSQKENNSRLNECFLNVPKNTSREYILQWLDLGDTGCHN